MHVGRWAPCGIYPIDVGLRRREGFWVSELCHETSFCNPRRKRIVVIYGGVKLTSLNHCGQDFLHPNFDVAHPPGVAGFTRPLDHCLSKLLDYLTKNVRCRVVRILWHVQQRRALTPEWKLFRQRCSEPLRVHVLTGKRRSATKDARANFGHIVTLFVLLSVHRRGAVES